MESMAIRNKTIRVQELMYTCYKRGLSCVVYQMPQSNESHLIIQWKEREDQNTGFVFAPFDHHKDKVFIQAHERFSFKGDTISMSEVTLGMILNIEPIPRNFNHTKVNCLGEEAYTSMIQDAIGAIQDNRFEKVVLSRAIEKELYCNAFLAWDKLRKKYSNAFVYYCYTPEMGEWVGATPEFLMARKGNQVETVALAGSRKAFTRDAWGEKEKEEQAIVGRYIKDQLKGLGIESIEESETRTHLAGPVEHLKTKFSFEFEGDDEDLIGRLHPTPAVCGIEKKAAFDFIKAEESYDRSFYTGYLGPVNMDGESAYFVNLRCMEMLANGVRLFVGGGITKDSEPSKEWEETELKATTILSVIE